MFLVNKSAAFVAAALPCFALAQGVAQEQQLDSVTIVGRREASVPIPNTTDSRGATELRELNFVNTEDALRTMSNVTVRKRYAGDRNALIGGRSHSTLQAARAMLFVDGYLLSQFLGNFNAPRWNMIAPEEVERIDILYGPFSALYPGNSIGTTIVATTRRPQTLEASGRVQFFNQHYQGDGFDGHAGGTQASAWLGNQSGRFWYSVGVNQLDARSQPMQYLTVLRNAATAPAANATPVSGATPWRDPQGNAGYLLGPNGSAIEDNWQVQGKVRAGFDFTPTLTTDVLASTWRSVGNRRGASSLRDANGNVVQSGAVSINGEGYTLPSSGFAPQKVDEEHQFIGTTLKTKNTQGWNGSAVLTLYNIRRDDTRSANSGAPDAPGVLADGSGTGWRTLDLQTTWTPSADSAFAAHQVAAGYHVNQYELTNRSYTVSNWLQGAPTGLSAGFLGRTSLQALFMQDQWQLLPQWSLTTGLRYEQWQASDGVRENASNRVSYAQRDAQAWSPKLSLAHTRGEWTWRAAYGRGTRFPTVSELFQGAISGSALVNNDPNLAPERSDATELSLQWRRSQNEWRVTLFEDDVRNTIQSQTDITVFPNITNIQNIDRVRTRGLELAGEINELLPNLKVGGNFAVNDATIVRNSRFPVSEGKRWLRIPRTRGALFATWTPLADWMFATALRYSGRQYANLDNSDINPNTFGGVSSVRQVDIKATWRPNTALEFGLGVDNLNNQRAYQFHPYPARTWIAELRASL